MAQPEPLPIRVLVKGSSMAHDISARPQQREQFTFGRVIEESLLRSGYGADVRVTAAAGDTCKRAFSTWEQEVKAWSPDVVILSYGAYECVHLFLPRWLERHVNSLSARPGLIRSFYRQRVLRPSWRLLFKVQKALDRRFSTTNFGRVQRGVVRDCIAYITQTRTVGNPLVVIMECTGPGAKGKRQFPGLADRINAMNEVLPRVVMHFDSPDVVMAPAPAIATSLPPEIPFNADGFHYGPELHQAVGEYLAEQIRAWAQKYPRLSP